MKKVITTVGTSIFQNYKEKTEQKYGELKKDTYYNKPYSEWDERYNKLEKGKIWKWLNSEENLNGISAEIKSLTKLQKERKEEFEVYLITTDTVASNLAAEIIKEYFENKDGITISQTNIIENLQVRDFSKFETGKDNLIKEISTLMKDFSKEENEEKRKKYYRNNVIFNVTGGYKGIISIMTILAQLYECEIYYIFEESNDMISIPRIPLNFDPILTEALFVDLWLKKENSNYRPENEKKLLQYGFINKKIEITSLGNLFYEMAFYHQATSQNVFGYFVEYKILEYLYLAGKIGFKHSYEEIGKDGKKRELDFVFQKTNDKWEIWEVKSANRFLNKKNWNELENQFRNQIENYSNISKYKLVVYSITDKLIDRISEIINQIMLNLKSDYQDIDFSAEFLLLTRLKSIKKQEEEKNPYQAMFKEKIKEKNFRTITLEEK
ncbi:MAG: hypothetical protein APR54_06405 [Candidatus Cloacimonas sp. SDB]|nr:MAG: hypothetical protein APR54_06405 [Candidatus Cloacimonas sp. SDB]